MNLSKDYRKPAVIISAVLILLVAASLVCMLLPLNKSSGGYIAEIYREGELLFRIPLNRITETKTFLIEGPGGCQNEIEVRPGSIGMIRADCPDKLCVRQGFISDARLPITCLPNRVVIRLRPASPGEGEKPEEPDAFTY